MPVAVTVKLQKEPAVKVLELGLVMSGAREMDDKTGTRKSVPPNDGPREGAVP